MYMDAANLLDTVLIQYMMVPYHVENWVVIIDVKELSIFGLPQKVLKSISVITALHYPGFMEKLYVVNSSRSLDILWKVITIIVDPDILEKTVVMKKKDMNKMTSILTPECLEKKYGGTLEDIREFWPPNPRLFKDQISLKEIIRNRKEPFIMTNETWRQVQRAKEEIARETKKEEGPKSLGEDFDFKDLDISESKEKLMMNESKKTKLDTRMV